MKENIALIGMTCSGKSEIGGILADRLGMRFVNSDDLIEYEYAPIERLLDLFGESGLAKYETRAIRQVSGYTDTVLATGYSTPMRGENMDALGESYIIVYLKATNKTVFERSKGKGMFSSEKDVASKSSKMRAIYSSYAEITVTTDGKNPEKIADEIIGKIEKMYK